MHNTKIITIQYVFYIKIVMCYLKRALMKRLVLTHINDIVNFSIVKVKMPAYISAFRNNLTIRPSVYSPSILSHMNTILLNRFFLPDGAFATPFNHSTTTSIK